MNAPRPGQTFREFPVAISRHACQLRATVLDCAGNVVGSGLDLTDEGTISRVLPPATDPEPGWVVPGFIDIHCHGGGGASFSAASGPEEITQALGVHRRAGTTATIASVVSLADPLPAIRNLVGACRDEDLTGIHLEGPYISPDRRGAHNRDVLRAPDIPELVSWLEAGQGWIRTMTLAPEQPMALEAAACLADYGARPSWGHTNADGPTARLAIDAAADDAASRAADPGRAVPWQTVTHLFNAMPAFNHRNPGPVREFLAAARDGDVVVELIADGIHLDPGLVADIAGYLNADGTGPGAAFVSDAMAGAGLSGGRYDLGGVAVDIADGVARVAGTETLAGSTATLADELAVMTGPGLMSVPEVVRALVAAPARALGLTGSDAGVTLSFEQGVRPNLVVLDEDAAVTAVMREGVWV